MADLLQITSPISPRDYQLLHKSQHIQPEQNFDLSDTSKILKTNQRSEELGKQNLPDGKATSLPKASTSISKNPFSASNALKAVIGEETFARIAESGDKELLSEITKFAREIMLTPENLSSDLVNQQKNATIFSNPLFAQLKGLYGKSSGEMNTAILDFMKAAAAANSQQEIMTSISSNLRYLATSVSRSRNLSSQLLNVADNLSAENFPLMKGNIRQLLDSLSQSLLLNDKTLNLIPLVTYNMSRVVNNSTLGESFDKLMSYISDSNLKSTLENSFNEFVTSSSMLPDAKLAALGGRFTDPLLASASRLAASAKQTAQSIDPIQLSNMLAKINTSKGTFSLRNILSLVVSPSNRDDIDALAKNFNDTKDLNGLVDKLSVVLNSIDSLEVKIPLAHRLNEVLESLAKTNGVNYRPPTSMENFADFLSKNLNDPTMRFAGAFNQTDLVTGLLTSPGVFSPLMHFLVPFDAYGMKAFGELWADPDANDVIRDKNSGNSEDSTPGSHLFMCFDIENTGYFELEILAKNNQLNVLLLCPPGTESAFSSIKKSVSTIASANGYSVSSTIVEPVHIKRDLSEVFPKINEKRFSINVKI